MMKKPITIIFVHKGYSWYVYYAIKQARRFNPTANIVLLTDQPYRELKGVAVVYPIDDCMRDAREFEDLYVHLSVNSYEFELFCFQRWFAINEFLRATKVTAWPVWHLDSDLLLYTDLGQEGAPNASSPLTLCGMQGPYVLGLNSADLLEAYCDHVKHLFENEADDLREQFEGWQVTDTNTAVSDMHAWHTFVSRNKIEVVDLQMVRNNSVFDSVSHEANGYLSNKDQKLYQFREGVPWCRSLKSGQDIRFKSIHCQGPYKHMMLKYFNAQDFKWLIHRIRGKLRGWVGSKR